MICITKKSTGSRPASNSSGSAIADGYSAALGNDRYLTLPPGESEHLREPTCVLGHVYVSCPLSIGRPGPPGVGSIFLSINDDLLCHVSLLCLNGLSMINTESVFMTDKVFERYTKIYG